jgi:polyphosphate kinase
VFDRHDDHWYRPDSDKYQFTVRLPDSDDRKYYKTQDNAAKRLRKEYDT